MTPAGAGAWPEMAPPDSAPSDDRAAQLRNQTHAHDLQRIQVIELHMMNPVKYYPLTMLSGCLVRGILYPFTLIKTRMQIQSGQEMYTGTWNALRTISHTEGFRGLYRGFLISNMLILPQVCYITVYENMRSLSERYGGMQNTKIKSAVGGLSASIASQTLIVPIDIISQHLMVISKQRAGYKTHTNLDMATLGQVTSRFGSTRAVIRAVYKTYGLRGFYKGYFTSLAVYGPNSGLWWLFYDVYCGVVSDVMPSWLPRLPLQCVAATLGGITTSLIMNPMDVIRARIQVKGERFGPTVRTLWAEERFRMLFKGLTARLIQSTTFSFAIILGYESIKRWSLLEEFQGSVRW